MSNKYSIVSTSLVVLCTVLVSACATNMSTKDYKPMSTAAIKQTLSGNTLYVTGWHNQTHWKWAGYYRQDGTAHGKAWWNGGKEEGKATWKVAANGTMCQHWNNEWDHGKQACFHYLRKGNTIITKPVTKGIVMRKATVEKGNPYKL